MYNLSSLLDSYIWQRNQKWQQQHPQLQSQVSEIDMENLGVYGTWKTSIQIKPPTKSVQLYFLPLQTQRAKWGSLFSEIQPPLPHFCQSDPPPPPPSPPLLPALCLHTEPPLVGSAGICGGAGKISQSGVRVPEGREGEPMIKPQEKKWAGPRAWVCDRRVDEEKRWQLLFDFIVNLIAINFSNL